MASTDRYYSSMEDSNEWGLGHVGWGWDFIKAKKVIRFTKLSFP